MKRAAHRLATLAAAAALAGAMAPSHAAAPPPSVIASIPPIHSLVASVMEGVGEPVLLIPGGASPHTFSLRPSDARRLASAEIVVWVGPALESSLRKPIKTLAGKAHLITLTETHGVTLLPVREGGAWAEHRHDAAGHAPGDEVEAHEGHAHGDGNHDHADREHAEHAGDPAHRHAEAESHDGHEIDSHMWLDTANARVIVETVAAALIARDPARAATYAANRDATLARLDALTARLEARLTPISNRPFIVLHDGYQYFERRFGLDAAGAIAVSPDIRPGARRIAELRDRLRAIGARCVFAEPQLDAALARTVAEGTGARIGRLDPIGADLPPGADLYPRLMEELAAGFNGCLAADG